MLGGILQIDEDDHDSGMGTLLGASVLLGLGLGGLFDGIVLHQLLQWHHMVSTPLPPNSLANMEANTLADGLFHAAGWVVTVAGILGLAVSGGARRHSGGTRTLIGGMLMGWGAFNMVEGLIDHHLLALHHVRPGHDEFFYDVSFLLWGVGMFVGGAVLRRRVSVRRSDAPR